MSNIHHNLEMSYRALEKALPTISRIHVSSVLDAMNSIREAKGAEGYIIPDAPVHPGMREGSGMQQLSAILAVHNALSLLEKLDEIQNSSFPYVNDAIDSICDIIHLEAIKKREIEKAAEQKNEIIVQKPIAKKSFLQKVINILRNGSKSK